MARPIKTQSKDIQQSNYFTTAKYDYTLQEKIILYRVAEQAFEYREANKEWFFPDLISSLALSILACSSGVIIKSSRPTFTKA